MKNADYHSILYGSLHIFLYLCGQILTNLQKESSKVD